MNDLMKKIIMHSLTGVAILVSQPALFSGEINRLLCPEALKRLVEGNKRFAEDKSIHPDNSVVRRQETAQQQKPFAVVVGCSDSRVSPEIVFDQGIGDLFIIRTAGNVVGKIELDSIEYSVLHLNACLIVVLGHENCGAVQAVMHGQTQDIETVAALIEPAIALARTGPGALTVQKAVKANVALVVKQLKDTQVINDLIVKEKVRVIGAYYHFETGQVELL